MDDRVTVTPPESLVKYNAPLFNGIQKDPNQSKGVVENTSKLDEMIHAMLPAREWVEESGIWTQHVSMEPASRLDVITLQVCPYSGFPVCNVFSSFRLFVFSLATFFNLTPRRISHHITIAGTTGFEIVRTQSP